VSFEAVAELVADPGDTAVYAEGWQTWSTAVVLRADATTPRPADARSHTMGWRPDAALPERGIQAEGILALAVPGAPVRAWFPPEPCIAVPSIRLQARGNRITVCADGPVEELALEERLDEALAQVGGRLSPGPAASIPPGWCSWSCYFGHVTEADVAENVRAAAALSLPVEIVQIDDGHETGIGDWLDSSPRFGSLRAAAQRISAAGLRPGVWTAPYLVGGLSALAAAHPDWLVDGADAGWNWHQPLRVLDVTHPAAAEHVSHVYRTLAGWGFDYYKLDFLYAGAIAGRRRADCSPIDAYREGLRLVRSAVGEGATLLGSGAPLLPSIGLVDAMRIGPDVLPEPPAGDPDIAHVIRSTRARAWMHGRLWANDPDCLVARPELAEREAWARQLAGYGWLAFSSDRLSALDERGLELTRQVLRPSSTEPSRLEPI
jgi:alpha-galactosidase